eukprot:13952393-Alexandrium_andersonii.AAC.1
MISRWPGRLPLWQPGGSCCAKGLSVEPEQRVDASGIAYLGCNTEEPSSKLPGGRMATVVAYNMEE